MKGVSPVAAVVVFAETLDAGASSTGFKVCTDCCTVELGAITRKLSLFSRLSMLLLIKCNICCVLTEGDVCARLVTFLSVLINSAGLISLS
uniref:Putative secreted protein n=1 Tax=Anopheles darlingi TaxID=43151 RepID=A0A2M4DLP1_ANODA